MMECDIGLISHQFHIVRTTTHGFYTGHRHVTALSAKLMSMHNRVTRPRFHTPDDW